MIKENQIEKIKKFLNSQEKTLVINQVNESIASAYLAIIEFLTNEENIKIKITDNTIIETNSIDLFKISEIEVFYVTNHKKLEEVVNNHNKKIIFTDYKNYKKMNLHFNSINGYKFEIDISFFIRKILNINDDNLLDYCKANPALLISETSKYLVNNNSYYKDKSLKEEKNHILDGRKSIFEIKKNKPDIINLYLKIKKEAEYKKFNFLAY